MRLSDKTKRALREAMYRSICDNDGITCDEFGAIAECMTGSFDEFAEARDYMCARLDRILEMEDKPYE